MRVCVSNLRLVRIRGMNVQGTKHSFLSSCASSIDLQAERSKECRAMPLRIPRAEIWKECRRPPAPVPPISEMGKPRPRAVKWFVQGCTINVKQKHENTRTHLVHQWYKARTVAVFAFHKGDHESYGLTSGPRILVLRLK